MLKVRGGATITDSSSRSDWMLRLFTLIFHYDIHKNALKWGMLPSLYFYFIKCYKNSIILSGPNRTSESPSYLFSLVEDFFELCGLFTIYQLYLHQMCWWGNSNTTLKKLWPHCVTPIKGSNFYGYIMLT